MLSVLKCLFRQETAHCFKECDMWDMTDCLNCSKNVFMEKNMTDNEPSLSSLFNMR